MKTLLKATTSSSEEFKTYKIETDLKLTKAAQENVRKLVFLAQQLEKSDDTKDLNSAKYVRSMCSEKNFSLQNFIAKYNIDLSKVARNKWGKMFWLADALVNKKIPTRKKYEQSNTMYDCFFNVLLKTEFNTHKGASFNSGNAGHRMGEIIDNGAPDGQFKGMKDKTQPNACLDVLAQLCETVRAKPVGSDWKTSRVTLSNETAFGKVLFKFIEECSEKKLKHISASAAFAPVTQAK